jgi:hypothetical protein
VLDPWPEDGHLLFFDLAGADEELGITLTLDEDNGWAERLYDSEGTLLVTSDPGGPLEAFDLAPGRYFIWLPFPATAISIPVEVSLGAIGSAAYIVASSPWELMVQGVAP